MFSVYKAHNSKVIIITKPFSTTSVKIGKLDSGLNYREISKLSLRFLIAINNLIFLSKEKTIADIRAKYL